MKKKIKQIIKIILAKKTSKESFFENNLKLNELVKEYKKIDEVYYEAQLVTGEKVLIRNHNYSDYSVFKQIFNNQEYGIILKMLQLNSSFNNKKYMAFPYGLDPKSVNEYYMNMTVYYLL